MKKEIKINEYRAPSTIVARIVPRRAISTSPFDPEYNESDSDPEELNF